MVLLCQDSSRRVKLSSSSAVSGRGAMLPGTSTAGVILRNAAMRVARHRTVACVSLLRLDDTTMAGWLSYCRFIFPAASTYFARNRIRHSRFTD